MSLSVGRSFGRSVVRSVVRVTNSRVWLWQLGTHWRRCRRGGLGFSFDKFDSFARAGGVSLSYDLLLPMAPHHEKNSRTPIPTRFGFRLWGGIDCSCRRCCIRKLLASIGLGNQDHSKVTFELSSSTILPDNAVVVVGFQGQGPCDGDVIAVCLHAYH